VLAEQLERVGELLWLPERPARATVGRRTSGLRDREWQVRLGVHRR
jgi:hypothetical protein